MGGSNIFGNKNYFPSVETCKTISKFFRCGRISKIDLHYNHFLGPAFPLSPPLSVCLTAYFAP